MPGCSKEKKAPCIARKDCTWIVGQGCKRDEAQPKTVALITDAEIKGLCSQVYPDHSVSKETKDYIKSLVAKLLAQSFKKLSKTEVTEEQVLHLSILGSWTKLAKLGKEEAKRVLQGSRTIISHQTFHKRVSASKFKNKDGKLVTFTKNGSLYLLGLLEFVVADMLDTSIGADPEPRTLKKGQLVKTLEQDEDYRMVFHPTQDWAVYVYNGQQVL